MRDLTQKQFGGVFLCLKQLCFRSYMSINSTDEQRGSSAQRGYGYKWQKAREAYLRKHPICFNCSRKGLVVAAIVVDHIKPHKGDMVLFWDSSNWQPLCKQCHDGYKKRLEISGRIAGCTTDGIPIDPNHHWHAVRQGG